MVSEGRTNRAHRDSKKVREVEGPNTFILLRIVLNEFSQLGEKKKKKKSVLEATLGCLGRGSAQDGRLGKDGQKLEDKAKRVHDKFCNSNGKTNVNKSSATNLGWKAA